MKKNELVQNLWFLMICSVGGFIFSLLGMSVGWMIGSLLVASILSFMQPKWTGIKENFKGINKHWQTIGQLIVGIQLGKQMNASIITLFQESWLLIIGMIFLSVLFALISGFLLFKYSNTDLLTGLFATSPGGVLSMPSIAEEVGANTAVVTVVQLIRVFFVVSIIPVVLFYGFAHSSAAQLTSTVISPDFLSWQHFFGTAVIIIAAIIGSYLAKKVKLPAPRIIGSIFAVGIIQAVFPTLLVWWPSTLMVIAMVLLGTSIGSGFQKQMFTGMKQILVVSSICTLGFIASMFLCSIIVAKITGISLITSVLAFAPGGVVEMATASVSLGGDATFVTAVQVLRIVLVILLLPVFFRFLYRKKSKQAMNSSAAS